MRPLMLAMFRRGAVGRDLSMKVMLFLCLVLENELKVQIWV